MHVHDPPLRERQSRALWISFALNGALLVAEVVGGVVFNSLALLADAAHMFSDVAGLGIALFAHGLIHRPASTRHTYGFLRAEILGAQANGVILLVTSGWVIYEAVGRIGDPEPVSGRGLLIVAGAGLLANLYSARLLSKSEEGSLNMRAATLHMLSDAAGSVGAIAAGAAVVLWDATWADPAVSIAIGILVLWSAWRLLRETTHVLMEGVPRHLDVTEVEAALQDDDEVESVHHLHVWNVASDMPALSAHVILSGEETLHGAQLHAERLKTMLHDRFGIEHSTLEIECHPCD